MNRLDEDAQTSSNQLLVLEILEDRERTKDYVDWALAVLESLPCELDNVTTLHTSLITLRDAVLDLPGLLSDIRDSADPQSTTADADADAALLVPSMLSLVETIATGVALLESLIRSYTDIYSPKPSSQTCTSPSPTPTHPGQKTMQRLVGVQQFLSWMEESDLDGFRDEIMQLWKDLSSGTSPPESESELEEVMWREERAGNRVMATAKL
ncbi:hypothetical protein JAAARDRAFT_211324 [Jaapia argillacea MUCL 33604]|uniref:Uncharacterized protein n=1 Tax=Jaapia argillacea MUCL 33604 TaxID=933084 RepID=A0A067PB24_9AGAM|nr:hypothetical protein JAAARDRAFT_211324 [Jaapia argillacea MUCL 33604]